MSSQLNEFLPPPETLLAVQRQLLDAGFNPEEIPREWLMVIMSAFGKWLKTSPDGKKYVVESLGLEWTTGDPRKEYRLLDGFGSPGPEIKPENVYYLRGLVINGEVTSPRLLTVKDKEQNSCERCNVTCHAVRNVLDLRSNRLTQLCNHCLMYDENPRIRDQGNARECSTCPHHACSHHTNDQQVAIRSASGGLV